MYKSTLLLIFVIVVAGASAQWCPGHTAFPMTVSSAAGTFSGTILADARSFLGIPFAKPPVGQLRFAKPVAASPISGTYNATSWPNSCYQASVTTTTGYTQSEDCLYLNVFTPRCKKLTFFPPQASSKLPVLVFIHGGRYWTGYSQQFPGNMLASERNAVVVSIQYRLNIFGFQSFDGNTNNGLVDQQMALQWVKNNIEAFGGDASSITIFGESAGGSSVLHHLINPASYGLYTRAILQSIWQWIIPTVETSRVKTAAWAVTKGCANVTVDGSPDYPSILSCLRNVPAATLNPTTGNSDFMVPMIDGKFIKTLPLNAIKKRQYNTNADIIMGHNYDEGNFMAYSRLGFRSPTTNITDALYESTLNRTLLVYLNQSSTDSILNTYDPIRQQLGNWYGAAQFFGDYYITCGSILAAQYLGLQGNPFKVYIFNYSSPNYPQSEYWTAASHGNELPYVFLQPIYTPYNFSTTDDVMAERMSSSWVNFARTGDPFSPFNIFTYWTTRYPIAQYFGPNAYGFFDTVFYTKSICQNWRPYYEAY